MKKFSLKTSVHAAGITALLVLLLSSSGKVGAQTAPEFMATWRAESFVPADFKGKALPTKKTRVEVVFNLIDNKKIAELRNVEVRWYVDNKLQQRGNGMQSFMFVVPDIAADENEIRIEIPDYKGVSIEKTIAIPITSPHLVIKSPYLGNEIKRGEITLTALPYFFNAQNIGELALRWIVNGEEAQQTEEAITSPNVLSMIIPEEIPLGGTIDVRTTAKNSTRDTEIAGRSILFTVTE